MNRADDIVSPGEGRRGFGPLFLAAALIPLLTLGSNVTHEFVDWDDTFFLSANPRFNPPTWHSVLGFVLVRNAGANIYIPVTNLFWGFLAAIGHTDHPDANASLLNPWVFHAASLGVHIASVGLVLAILRRVTGDMAALLGAIVFAIHPIQVEAVAWASEMKDLLAGMFGFGCLYSLIRFRQSNGRGWWIAATGAAALAMLSKPSAVVLPLEAMLVDMMLMRTRLGRSLAWLWPWFIIAVPIFLIAHQLQPALWQDGNPVAGRPMVALDTVAFYLAKLIAPVHLIFDYGRTPQAVRARGFQIIWMLPLVAAGLLIWKGKRFPLLICGCLLAIAGIAPVLGLVPFAAQDYSTVSNHYLYPSMLGIAMVSAFFYEAAMRRFGGAITISISVLIVGCMGVLSFADADMWRDSFSLFSRELELNPQSSCGHAGMASTLAAAGDMPGAEANFREAVRLNPHNGMAIMGLANMLMHEGDLDGAAAAYERLIQVYKMQSNFDPKLGAAGEMVIAVRLMKRGDAEGAIKALDQAKAWDPANPQLDVLLARARASVSTRPATAAHAGL